MSTTQKKVNSATPKLAQARLPVSPTKQGTQAKQVNPVKQAKQGTPVSPTKQGTQAKQGTPVSPAKQGTQSKQGTQAKQGTPVSPTKQGTQAKQVNYISKGADPTTISILQNAMKEKYNAKLEELSLKLEKKNLKKKSGAGGWVFLIIFLVCVVGGTILYFVFQFIMNPIGSVFGMINPF